MGHLALRSILLHILTCTSWQLWTFEAHMLHMLHLNTPDELEGHVFQNLLSIGFEEIYVEDSEDGTRAVPLLHTKTPCICFRSYSFIISNIQSFKAYKHRAIKTFTWELEKHFAYLALSQKEATLIYNQELCHKFNGVIIQRSCFTHHSRPPTPSKPVPKVNFILKYFWRVTPWTHKPELI